MQQYITIVELYDSWNVSECILFMYEIIYFYVHEKALYLGPHAQNPLV